jgi:hypothetical protein
MAGASNNYSRPSTAKKVPVAEAKARVIELIQGGLKVEEACQAVERSKETYRTWMREDQAFHDAVSSIREARHEEKETGRPAVPDFDVFCAEWLHQPLHPHQMRMWDVIEGRAPRDIHPSMDYMPGYSDRVLINVPPDHAKSTTFTVNYSVWLIHKNPDVRIVLMSQSETLAKRFLGEIKFKLTSPMYRPMHMRFGPADGWKSTESEWSTNAIYVQGKGGDKDPTVQALGLKGQLYGSRSDVIFLDDIITTKNAREIDNQMILIDREIESRLPSEQEGGGLLAILGTRVAPLDLYRSLIDVTDGDDERVWTYFRMPAVVDYGNGDSSTWTTLWPEKYNGKSLAKRKRSGGAAWNLIYQQLNVDEDMPFIAEAVEASIEYRRFPGPMTEAGMGHRERGMEGLYLVGGIDPAASGNTAIIIAGVDPTNEKRYVIDGWNKRNATAGDIIEKFKYLTEKYGLNEWIVEKNAFQRFFAQLPEIKEFCRARGCKITEHYTTANKYDSDWGVQTMAPLFESCGQPDPKNPSGKWARTPKSALIELPSTRQNEWVNDLVQQLITWMPEGMTRSLKSDLVMALWFTHIAFTKMLRRSRKRPTHLKTPFMTHSGRNRQQVIDLTAIRAEKQHQRELAEGTAHG